MSTSSQKSLGSLGSAFGFEAPNTNLVGLKDVLKELQGLRLSFADGGAQSTAISLLAKGGATLGASRILTTDPILGVVEFTAVAASGLTNISLRNDCRVVSTGNIQFSGGATTNSKILVLWFDQSGFLANA